MSTVAATGTPRTGWSRAASARQGARAHVLAGAIALAGSAVLGALATSSPIAAATVAAGVLLLAVAVTRPAWLLAGAICLLGVETARIFGATPLIGRPGTYKLLLYACVIPLLLERGVDRRRCAPLLAYAALVVLTESLATPLAGLSIGQTASSLATLALAWLVFAIRWDPRRDMRLLKALAWVPTLSVLLGAVLSARGVLTLLGASPPRLQGATLAATLGALGVAGVLACVVLYRMERWRHARWLALANVAILGASLSRGAVLALAIVSLPTLVRFWRDQAARRGARVLAKVAVAVAIAVTGAVVLGSGLIARTEQASDYVAGRGLSHELGSGRFQAWSVAFEQAEANIIFGRGLGAGPIVGHTPGSPQGFTAQHNEYLRMLLEGGIVGALVVLVSIAWTLAGNIRRAPPLVRADLWVGAAALAVFSLTENTLTTPAISLAFLLIFAIATAPYVPAEVRA
jgi:O-antigen ligase